MKLLSCHIENFGNMSGRDFDFGKNPTALCEPNGYGKTTLAAFIKAMFYGLPTTRGKSFDERQRYLPFGGGKFGGNLTFSANGKIYRIERFFDKKSQTGDETKLYSGGKELPAPENIGKDIFGLDEASFMRTVFIDSTADMSGVTGGISEKLNKFVDNADEGGFDKAYGLLEKAQKALKAQRGGGGKINERNDRIKNLEDKRRNAENVSAKLGEKYRERERLEAEIAQTEKSLKAAASLDGVYQQWENYERLLARASGAAEEIEKLKAKYPAGLPSEEELSALNAAATRKANEKSRLEASAFTAEKESRLKELENVKLKNLPDESAIGDCREKISELGAMRERLKSVPAAVATAAEAKKGAKLPVVLIAFAAAIIIIGVVLAVTVNLLTGIIALVVGVCSAFASGFAYFSTRLKAVAAPAEANPEYLKLQSEITILESNIKGFLSGYGYLTESGAEADFNNLITDINKLKLEYTLLDGERKASEESAAHTRAVIEECDAETDRILNKYSIRVDGGLAETIKRLENYSREYAYYGKRLKELSAEAQNYKAEYALTEKPEGERKDTGRLSEKLTLLNKELTRVDREISDDEAVTEKLPSIVSELENERTLLGEDKKKHEVLGKAKEFLQKAENNLKEKYILPVKERFLRYSAALEEALGEKVVFDTDFNIKYERGGEIRSDRHLSAGQYGLCALCLRLALVDVMFTEERPFIILDDPFVNLDAEHMSRAAKLLKELAKNVQIIYFSCHESRDIG